MKDLRALARALIPAVLAAGKIEMEYYRADIEVLEKEDGSPVTLADRKAEALILAELKRLAPGIPVVGEESVSAAPDISGGTFFLVDALDGTRDFITGGGDFTVNVGLVVDFRPVMGVIHAPLPGKVWHGAEGQAFCGDARIQARRTPDDGLTVAVSRRAEDGAVAEFLQGMRVKETLRRSSSLKFCAIAEGAADIYPRLGPTCEWDTAAGEAIVVASGGSVLGLDGRPLAYGKAPRFLNAHFVARGVMA